MRKRLHYYSHILVSILGCVLPLVIILGRGRIFPQHLRCSNKFTNGRRKKTIAINTNMNSTVRDNIANIFGARRIQNLMEFSINLEKDDIETEQQVTQLGMKDTSIKGFISKPSAESHHIDRQLFYVNSRPCFLPQVSKTFNEIYKIFNLSFSPFIFANLLISSEHYETRHLPGKTTVHLHDEQELLEALKSSLSQLLKAQPFSFPQNSKSSQATTLEPQLSRERASKTSRGDLYKNAESHEENYTAHHNDNSTRGTSSLATHQTAIGTIKDGISDVESDVSTLSSKDCDQEQKEQSFPRGAALRQHRQLTQSNKTEPNVECGNYYRSSKRPKLEKIRNDSTLAAQSIKFALSSENKVLEPEYVINNKHDEDGSISMRETKTALASVDHDDIERQAISTGVVSDGISTELNKPGSLPHGEKSQTQSKKIDEKIGFAFAKDHNDIIQLKNGDHARLKGHIRTENDNDELTQINLLIDQGSEPKKTQDHVSSGFIDNKETVADERDYRESQKSKVSSLIAEAEEAKAISFKTLNNRAKSTLNNVHKYEIVTKPIRYLNFSPSSSRTYIKKLESILRIDQSKMKSDVREMEEKVGLLSLSKSEFANMRVIGQFNFGFVLAATNVQTTAISSQDLFIIDQHASDEKYNFETLENTLSVTSQRLAHPQRIELTAMEEELVLRYNDVLLKNGFQVAHGEAGSTVNGSQQQLVGLPSLGGVLYNKSDFQDLLNVLNESNGAKLEHGFSVPRPAKTRKILAMKACRSSIMIGTSLSKGQMKQIILQMGQIDKPWHCPHGRPTIKYLSSLSKFQHWKEGDGIVGMATSSGQNTCTNWEAYLR